MLRNASKLQPVFDRGLKRRQKIYRLIISIYADDIHASLLSTQSPKLEIISYDRVLHWGKVQLRPKSVFQNRGFNLPYVSSPLGNFIFKSRICFFFTWRKDFCLVCVEWGGKGRQLLHGQYQIGLVVAFGAGSFKRSIPVMMLTSKDRQWSWLVLKQNPDQDRYRLT